MPTMNGQDNALSGLMASKQWKQAFNMCEKKLKKAPTSDYLLVTKILILIQWQDPLRNHQGIKELKNLLERTPPVVDLEALHALDNLLGLPAFLVQDPLTLKQKQIWQRAAAYRTQDENLHSIWYNSKLEQWDLRSAQQACMAWMKNFPQERKPFFLYILVSHMLSERVGDEKEKQFMQALAYKYLSKAATDSQESTVPKSGTERQIQHFEDISLLLQIYRAQGRSAEAIKVVTDGRIGMQSQSGSNRWELAKQYLEMLEEREEWSALRLMCHSMLSQAREPDFSDRQFGFGKLGNDWSTWRLYIRANINDDPAQGSVEVEETIQLFCSPDAKIYERNARIALLMFYSIEVFERRKDQSILFQAITTYFRQFSFKYVCFLDLKPWLSHLDPEGQEQLLFDSAEIAQDARPQVGESESGMVYWITSEINTLKMEYYLVISRDWNTHRVDLLATFVSSCLRLYKVSLDFGVELPVSDRRPGDDAALLAAMGLIRLFKAGVKCSLLQSIVILEHTLLQSKHNYDALLILVRLYMFLGAGSLAMERYDRLSIKNVQHATISWVLYTRLSTIHPYPARYPTNRRTEKLIDPLEQTLQSLEWFKSAENLAQKSVHSMQDNNLWSMSLDSLATSKAISTSFAKVLFFVESRRMERIRCPSKALPKHDFPVPEQTRDTRDRSAFPDFEGGELTFEEHLPMAGTSVNENDQWLHHHLTLAHFWETLKNGGHANNMMEEDLNAMSDHDLGSKGSFTAAESTTASLVKHLCLVYNLFIDQELYDQVTSEDVQTFAIIFNGWADSTSQKLDYSVKSGNYASLQVAPDVKLPIWSLLHELYSHLDQCAFVLLTMEFALSQNKRQPFNERQQIIPDAKILRDKCMAIASQVWQLATDIQRKLRDRSLVQRIDQFVSGHSSDTTRDPVAEELRSLEDAPRVQQIIRDLRDSWIDGLDGVIQTKIA